MLHLSFSRDVSASRPFDHSPNALKCRRDFPAKPIRVALADLRPTQMAVGMRAVAAKREKIERRVHRRRKLRRYLEARPIPAILGPGGSPFIIDHHHLSLALWQSDVDEAYVRILANMSDLGPSHFLKKMSALGLLHAYDADGLPICPTELPSSLRALRSDPFRDLAWSVREAGGFAKTNIPFSEFHWAGFFRARIPRSTVRRDFDLAHDRAMWLARSRDASRMPGYISR